MKLSEFELEVMQRIWARGTATAPDVHQDIDGERALSYSAVKTIFDRLERKGAIHRKTQVGRTIVYAPSITADRARSRLLRDFLARVFPESDRTPLLNALVRDGQLSAEEIDYLEALLSERRS